MKQVVNLNLLNPNKVIIDTKDGIYIVISISYNKRESTCDLRLIEISKGFATISMTLPMACDSDLDFVSPNDKDWVFRFYETDIDKAELSKMLRNEIREKIDLELKQLK